MIRDLKNLKKVNNHTTLNDKTNIGTSHIII